MIRPLRGYVLVELLEEDNSSPSGKLIIPDSAKEKPMKGSIIGWGRGYGKYMSDGEITPAHTSNDLDWDIQKGDIVYFKRWGGDAIKIEGKDYQFVKFEDLLGVEE